MAIIPVFIPHAGCPHQCVFCNQKTISGQQTASSRDVEQQFERYLQWTTGPFQRSGFLRRLVYRFAGRLETELSDL